ncbi:hypothetical protein RRG08_043737 [Elysia crispata]|uniref:Uncharacterized protein n=1 Tax=Elysia crispata TaxID=231223 RepID=A0AAE0ZNN5_9GAST|nr:hypothetical protein RRG08_043737 [Elysia crispata]
METVLEAGDTAEEPRWKRTFSFKKRTELEEVYSILLEDPGPCLDSDMWCPSRHLPRRLLGAMTYSSVIPVSFVLKGDHLMETMHYAR